MDLAGKRLVVTGRLIQSGGILHVNGGTLVVSGDYPQFQTETVSGGTSTYGPSHGYLKMMNAADRVEVGGSFATQSYYDHTPHLTAGIMTVKGDFTQKFGGNYSTNFRASGTHKVVLAGTSLQTIYFDNPGYLRIVLQYIGGSRTPPREGCASPHPSW